MPTPCMSFYQILRKIVTQTSKRKMAKMKRTQISHQITSQQKMVRVKRVTFTGCFNKTNLGNLRIRHRTRSLFLVCLGLCFSVGRRLIASSCTECRAITTCQVINLIFNKPNGMENHDWKWIGFLEMSSSVISHVPEKAAQTDFLTPPSRKMGCIFSSTSDDRRWNKQLFRTCFYNVYLCQIVKGKFIGELAVLQNSSPTI